jgi:hypothetical protein
MQVFFTGFSGKTGFFKTGFFMENVHVRWSKSEKNTTLKYATTMTAHISRVGQQKY